MRTLSPDEVRSFYDHFGTKQDRQAFYEASALAALVEHADLGNAGAVFELGCGTGRFAADLLRRLLPADSSYSGVDVSETMVRLASERLAPFGPRASVVLTSGPPPLPLSDSSVDRFLSTYVLDLLPASAVQDVLAEAARVLRPGGLLGLAGITHGSTLVSRPVMRVWEWLFSKNPSWVGGCRPTALTDHVQPSAWETRFHTVVVSWGIASEVLVASPRRHR
jgi:ubiquinone/menaquinone biosynthesis C-methylase UbiE